jgi:hypothetical protein
MPGITLFRCMMEVFADLDAPNVGKIEIELRMPLRFPGRSRAMMVDPSRKSNWQLNPTNCKNA